MVVLSCLRPCAQQGLRRVVLPTFRKSTVTYILKAKPLTLPQNAIQRRFMGNLFKVRTGMYTERQWRDDILFYVQLAVLPWLIVIFLVNVFIGDAELADVPEGYTPRHWEYQRHPISRFFAKYFCNSFEKDYEMLADQLVAHELQANHRLQYWEVKRLCDVRQNVIGWYRLTPSTELDERSVKRMEEKISGEMEQ